jgi:hypothetical protein
MTAVVEASETFSVCVTDLYVTADVRHYPLNITLGTCRGDSVEGVKIIKNSTNHQVCICADSNNGTSDVTIHDGIKKIDCLIIPSSKLKPVVLKYNEATKTWCLQP